MLVAPSRRLAIGSLLLAGLSVSIVGGSLGGVGVAVRGAARAPTPDGLKTGCPWLFATRIRRGEVEGTGERSWGGDKRGTPPKARF